MTNPSDETRRLLTEYIGECWHELSEFVHVGDDFQDNISDIFGHCLKCDNVFERGQENLTFTTPADLHAVYGAMWKNGGWEAFCEYAFDYETEGLSPHNVKANQDGLFYDTKFTAWLFCLSDHSQIPERMAMVCEFLPKEEGQ